MLGRSRRFAARTHRSAHCGAAFQSWQEIGAQENTFGSLHRGKTRYTWATDVADLPKWLAIGAPKGVGKMVLVGRALRAEQCAECMGTRAPVAKTGTETVS
jgi:hypothetical protein